MGLGFSIDAALSSTVPSSFLAPKAVVKPVVNELLEGLLGEKGLKDSWFFDIHEDTEEELATNLMEHGACTLEISSDEECAARARDARGKENVPPLDDVSQTRTLITARQGGASGDDVVGANEVMVMEAKVRLRGVRRKRESEDAIEVDRCPLGDLAAENFYAEGCDGESVVFVQDDEVVEGEGEGEGVSEVQPESELSVEVEVVAEDKGKEIQVEVEVEVAQLMQKDAFEVAPQAALFEPIEKAEEGFEVWERGRAKEGEEL